MSTYYRPPGQSTARSTALTSWGSGILLTTWPGPSIYSFSGTGLSALPLSIPSQTLGFAAATNDPAGNAWIVGYYGSAVEVLTNGTTINYSLPSSKCFTGVAFCHGHPYFLESSGALYTIASGAVALVSGGFGETAVGLSTDGAYLYAALPTSQHLGVFTLTSYVSGAATKVSTPMATPASTAASASGVAVAGITNAALVSGAVSLAVSPTGLYAAAVNTSNNAVMLLSGPDPSWQVTSAVAGQGAPVDIAWASAGEQVIVTDTTNAGVSIYNLANNALSFSANIATTGANQVAVTPDGITALVTRTTASAIRVLANATNVWTTQADIPITGSPGVLTMISNTEAVAGYIPSGGNGGLVWLAKSNGAWGVEAQVALPFAVSGIALDLTGTAYAVGTTVASGSGLPTGYLYAAVKSGVLASTSWVGRGDAVVWAQAQIAVLDTTVSASFSLDGGVLLVSASAYYPTSPSGLAAGAVWSNDGAVAVIPGITPNPSAPPLYYANATPPQLLSLGGGNLPLTPPVTGSGQLWNNGGEVAVS